MNSLKFGEAIAFLAMALFLLPFAPLILLVYFGTVEWGKGERPNPVILGVLLAYAAIGYHLVVNTGVFV